jgi:hypothetical protein
MSKYDIKLQDGTEMKGLKKIDYAGHVAYGKEISEGSDTYIVRDIYFPEQLKDIVPT